MAKDVEGENWTGSPMEARFCNFSTGHSDVRADHSVAPILKANPSAWTGLIGYASRLGYASGDSHQRNRELSQARCASVQREICRYVSNARFNVIDPEGDVDSTLGSQDDGFWRAVKLRIFGAQPQPAPTPPRGCKGSVVPWDYVWNPHHLRPPGVPGWAEGST